MNNDFVRYPTDRWIRDGRRSSLDDRVIPVSSIDDKSEDEIGVGREPVPKNVFRQVNSMFASKKQKRQVRFAETHEVIDDQPQVSQSIKRNLIVHRVEKKNVRWNELNAMNKYTRVDGSYEQTMSVLAHKIVFDGYAQSANGRTVAAAGELIAADKVFISALPDTSAEKGEKHQEKKDKKTTKMKLQSGKIGPTPGEVLEPMNSQFAESEMRVIVQSFCVERHRQHDFDRYIQPCQQQEMKPTTAVKQNLNKKMEQLAFNIPGKTATLGMDERKYTVAPRHMGEGTIKSQVKSVSELDAILSSPAATHGSSAYHDEKATATDESTDTHGQKDTHKKRKKDKKRNVQKSESIQLDKDVAGIGENEQSKKPKKVRFIEVLQANVGPTPAEKLEPLVKLTEAELRSKVMGFCVERSNENDTAVHISKGDTVNADEKPIDKTDNSKEALRYNDKGMNKNKKANAHIHESMETGNEEMEYSDMSKKIMKGKMRNVKHAKVVLKPCEALIQPIAAELRSKVTECSVEWNTNETPANREEKPKQSKLKTLKKTVGRLVPGHKNKPKVADGTHPSAEESEANSIIEKQVPKPIIAWAAEDVKVGRSKAYKRTKVERICIRSTQGTTESTEEADTDETQSTSDDSGEKALTIDATTDASPSGIEDQLLGGDMRPTNTHGKADVEAATENTQLPKKKKRTVFRRAVDRLFRKKTDN